MFNRLYLAYSTIKNFSLNPLANLSNLEKGLVSHSTLPDENLVKRLLNSYHKAKSEQKNAPPPYQPAGEWDVHIKKRRTDYLKALEDNDIPLLGKLLMNFCRNSGIMSLYTYGSYQSIHNSNSLHKKWFVNCLLHDYAVWKDLLDEADIKSLDAPLIGNPWGYMLNGVLITSVYSYQHYYATQVKNLLSEIPNPVVAEIGGGFGGFAYYLLSSGNYKYINFDLPEILLIAQYYLITAFPEKKFFCLGKVLTLITMT